MNGVELKKDQYILKEKISNVTVIFLLLTRLSENYLVIWIYGANAPDWFRYWYSGMSYLLTVVVVWLNKHKLVELHVDRPFINVLIFSGVLYAISLRYGIGILVGIAVGLIFLEYKNNQLVLNKPIRYPKEVALLVLLTVLLALAPVLIFRPTLRSPLDLNSFITTFSQTIIGNLAIVVFEEVLFRGALWAYLRSLGLSEKTAFYATSIFFWISHYGLLALSKPYVFWVSLPALAILLGLMTWRSKSLTPSTISHFIFNLISQILLIAFI
jgi:membrane protease YdiL (CAAX protease family)